MYTVIDIGDSDQFIAAEAVVAAALAAGRGVDAVADRFASDRDVGVAAEAAVSAVWLQVLVRPAEQQHRSHWVVAAAAVVPREAAVYYQRQRHGAAAAAVCPSAVAVCPARRGRVALQPRQQVLQQVPQVQRVTVVAARYR